MPAAAHSRRTFRALIDQARALTGAATGRLLAVDGEQLRVLACSGAEPGAGGAPGELIGIGRIQAYALSVGQPVALMPQPDDGASAGAGGYAGVPPSILAAACGTPPSVGLLELAGKRTGPSFGLHDLGLAGGLAAVAAAAIADLAASAPDGGLRPAPPGTLAAGLAQLADTDPDRYRDLAVLLERLLAPRP